MSGPGVRPVRPEHLDRRTKWIVAYEAAAKGCASCRFLEVVGEGAKAPAVEDVRALHDDLSRALSDLPLA